MEAHACNEWPLGTKTVIPQHTSTEERINVAKQFQKQYNWIIPMAVDTINNEFHKAFYAWPERLFVVKDGKMAFIDQAPEDGFGQLWPDLLEQFLDNTK